MSYLQLSFSITESEFSEVDAILDRVGALSVTTMDREDIPILEPAPGETPLWANLIVTALFPENKNRTKIERALTFSLGERFFTWQTLAEQNWERAWLTDYQPLQFGNTLWVGPHDFAPPQDVKATLFLDPGLAFGTGTHPTTYLCLEWLSENDLTGKTLLDFGCGSGILALAALKLGAKQASGTDIDPQAFAASLENAKRNDIGSEFQAYHAYVGENSVDILIANILANPLVKLASTLISYLKKNGIILLSGILKDQADHVKAAYLDNIHWTETKIKDDWVRLVGQKI